MKYNLKITLGIATLALAAFAAAAGDPVGTWNGKLQLDMKKLEATMEAMMKNATPAQKAQAKEQMKKIGDVTLVLSLKKDKSALMKTNTPAGTPGAKPKDVAGTWSASGNQITVKMTGQGNNQPLILKMAADGKSMTGDIPGMGGAGSQGKISFKKA